MSLCHFCHGTDTATTKYQEIIIFISFFTWHRYSTRKQQIPCNNYLYVIFLMAPIEHNKIPGNNYLCHFPMAQIQHNKIPSNNDICIIFFHDTDFVTTKYQVIMISVSFSPWLKYITANAHRTYFGAFNRRKKLKEFDIFVVSSYTSSCHICVTVMYRASMKAKILNIFFCWSISLFV